MDTNGGSTFEGVAVVSAAAEFPLRRSAVGGKVIESIGCMAFECRRSPVLSCFSAVLGSLRAVIRSELSILRRPSDDLPHLVPGVAAHTRQQIGHCRIPRISGPVTLIGDLITSEGGNIPIVRGRIPGACGVRALR